MSLVLLGNRQKNASGAGAHISIEEQATFTNYFSNPIVLPPYSQVALHGAKLVRNTVITAEPLLFVRLKGIPITSYNGVNSGISQIVGTIEDFNLVANHRPNAGHPIDTLNASGAIYRAVASPVYIDLNNPHPMRLSELSVDVVKDTEEIVSHLRGETNIILHFRRGRAKKPDIE